MQEIQNHSRSFFLLFVSALEGIMWLYTFLNKSHFLVKLNHKNKKFLFRLRLVVFLKQNDYNLLNNTTIVKILNTSVNF